MDLPSHVNVDLDETMRRRALKKLDKKHINWSQVHRTKFFSERRLAALHATYTVDDLRLILKGKTWQNLLDEMFAGTEGVQFMVRIGVFLNKACLAVVALDKIVVMRYIPDKKPDSWTMMSVIDGTNKGGFGALYSDFINGRTGSIALSDLVIGDEP